VQPYDILNGHRQNYIYAFTLQPYALLKAKNTWVKSVLYGVPYDNLL